ncbi:MAG: L-threonylcarbamoyladenylate synthase [bacterium]|nr:L-threonylcarbamoyladenylate synthase [bacterium]
MLISIHPTTPEPRIVQQICDGLSRGGLYILPTDTAYAFVAALDSPRAINEIYRLKNLPEKRALSILCKDVAMASHYAVNIPNPIFRFMKTETPGPYTFILKANRNVDRRGLGRKKEVGVRIVNHPLHRALMERLDTPLISSSLTTDDEYVTDPEELAELYGKAVEAVIDGGVRPKEVSTIIDCTEDPPRLTRQGEGDVSGLENLLDLDDAD